MVWGGMLLLMFGAMFMDMRALNADQGELVGFAIGEVDAGNECQLQAVITLMMTASDAPCQTVNSESTTIDWALFVN